MNLSVLAAVIESFAILILCVSCSTTPQPVTVTPKKSEICEAALSRDRTALGKALDVVNDVNQADNYGRSALFCAVKYSSSEIVQDILDHGANPNHVADNGDTPILVAARIGSLPLVEVLVSAGADIDYVGEDGMSSLMIATTQSKRSLFDGILSLGANPNASSSGFDTPLIFAIKKADPYFADRLLEAGANPDAPGSRGITPLMAALRTGHFTMAMNLLALNTRASQVDGEGADALTYAVGAAGVDLTLLQRLDDAGADPNRKTRTGMTPLMIAVHAGRLDIVNFLLEHGADVNATTDHNYTALMIALAKSPSDLAILDLLIMHRSDVNITANDGMTAIKLACLHEDSEAIGYLYSHNAHAEYDPATPEGLQLSGTLKQALGDYYFATGQYKQARNEYDKAGSYFQEMGQRKSEAAFLTSFLETFESISAFLLSIPLPQGQDYSSDRQFQQASALSYAEKTGTGNSGYYSYLESNRAAFIPFNSFRNETKQTKLVISQTGTEEAKHEILEQANIYRQRSNLMNNFVDCFDKSNLKKEIQTCLNNAMKLNVQNNN